MPKSRVPDGPRSKAGKERAKQEKEAEAARRELNVRKIAALENAQSAVSAMERTPEANRRLNTTTTTKDTPASRESTSDDEVEDQEEDNMDVDENEGSPYKSASESSTEEPAPECDDGPSEPASEPDEAPKGSRKKKEKMPVRVAINNYRAHEEPIVVASTPSSDFAGGQPRAPVKRIVSQGKRRMESHTLV